MELKATLNETGYKYYKINIKEEYDLKEDPKVSCENYPTRNGYGQVHLNLNFLVQICNLLYQCLDEEYLNQALNIMNCSPPFLTNKKQFWCNSSIEFSTNNVNFLWKLGGGIMDDRKCLPPCQKTMCVTFNQFYTSLLIESNSDIS